MEQRHVWTIPTGSLSISATRVASKLEQIALLLLQTMQKLILQKSQNSGTLY